MKSKVLSGIGIAFVAIGFLYIFSSGPVLAYIALRSNYDSPTLKKASKPYLPVVLLFGVNASHWYFAKWYDMLKPYVHSKSS